MKRIRQTKERITNQCVRWYRRHGNDCEISVWKLIRLVGGCYGITKIEKSEIEYAKRYASKIENDLSVMDATNK